VAGGNVAATYWPEVNPSKHHRNKVIRDNCTHVLVLRTFPDNHPVLGKLPLMHAEPGHQQVRVASAVGYM
jgi:hypothetical protein